MKRPLKLCPCCGKDGEAETHFYSIFGVISYNAVCRKCGIQTERYETEAKAATAWNTRPYEDELTAERDRFRERCAELEARLDLGTGNMYDVVCAENEKLREAISRVNAANMSEDECISKLLDDDDHEVEDVIFSSDAFLPNGTAKAEGEYFSDEDYARIYRDINEQVEAVRPLMEVFREDDAALKKLLDDFQVTITITPKTLPDNEEDDCEPDGTD